MVVPTAAVHRVHVVRPRPRGGPALSRRAEDHEHQPEGDEHRDDRLERGRGQQHEQQHRPDDAAGQRHRQPGAADGWPGTDELVAVAP